MVENRTAREKALLVEPDTGEWDAEASLAELYDLVRSAGAEPFGAVTQTRPAPDAATCVGSGMIKRIAGSCREYGINLLVFDCELSPTQLRNVEKETGVRTVDRTMLILDIFADRAKSREGRLQVELAELKYMLPRLSGKGRQLSRLGGGIGTRGPGESRLETDRRRIRRRINLLSGKLENLKKRRDLTADRRRKDGIVTVALVGYTNAGKSSLMNALTGADVSVDNRLFETLDPTARALRLPGGESVMLIDTVGFLRRLPHRLIEAFQSTLEQAATADIILNICDASNSDAPSQLNITRSLLADLGCEGRPILTVLNKCDLLPRIGTLPMIGRAIRVSAKTGEGLDELLNAIEDNLPEYRRVRVLLPFSLSGLAEQIRTTGAVESEEFTDRGRILTARIPASLAAAVRDYLI